MPKPGLKKNNEERCSWPLLAELEKEAGVALKEAKEVWILTGEEG